MHLKNLFILFFISRLLILLIICGVSFTSITTLPARGGVIHHSTLNQKGDVGLEKLKNILLSADSAWYMEIANDGYPKENLMPLSPKHWVFFPLFPILVKGLTYITSSYILSALILNCSCFLLALICINTFLKNEGFPEDNIGFIISFLCFFPTSYFFSTPHTESLFILLFSLTLLSIQKKSLLLSSFYFGLCLISRPTALLIAPGIALFAKKASLPLFKFTILSTIPFLLFCTYLYQLAGNPLAWYSNQAAWGRNGNILDFIYSCKIEAMIAPWSLNLLHIVILLLAIFSIYTFYRNRNWAFLLITILPIISILQTGTLLSLTRILMPLFTIPIALSNATSTHAKSIIILTLSFLLGLTCLLYALQASIAMT